MHKSGRKQVKKRRLVDALSRRQRTESHATDEGIFQGQWECSPSGGCPLDASPR